MMMMMMMKEALINVAVRDATDDDARWLRTGNASVQGYGEGGR